jgi:DNA-binding NarL/FixJ family response regulator
MEACMTVRVAVVEDSAPFRQSLELVLRHTPGFELAGAFGSVPALERAMDDPRARAASWSVVLMDLDLPGVHGIEGIRRVKQRLPRLPVVVCTVFEEPATIVDAIGAGADGYLLKGAALPALLDQLATVVAGGASLSSSVARTLLDVVRRDAGAAAAPSRLDLTDRERDVLRGLVQGGSYKQIADQLGITENTARGYIKAMYRKLQVQNVAEAVSRAIRERLV